MKKNRLVVSIAGSITLIACSLVPVTVSANCFAKNGKLHIDKYELRLEQKQPRCIEMGQSFIIKVRPKGSAENPGKGKITVHEKIESPTSPKIRGSNSAKEDEIVVTISAPQQPIGLDAEFDYYIEVEGIGKLDPKVRIITRDVYRSARWEALHEVLDEELGMDLEEIEMLLRDPPATAE